MLGSRYPWFSVFRYSVTVALVHSQLLRGFPLSLQMAPTWIHLEHYLQIRKAPLRVTVLLLSFVQKGKVKSLYVHQRDFTQNKYIGGSEKCSPMSRPLFVALRWNTYLLTYLLKQHFLFPRTHTVLVQRVKTQMITGKDCTGRTECKKDRTGQEGWKEATRELS